MNQTRCVPLLRAGIGAVLLFVLEPHGVLAQELTVTDLGTLGGSESFAVDVSQGGAVVVGDSDTGMGTRAFRWTKDGMMQDLGTLPGGTSSSAEGVSADGAVIVGTSRNADGSQAFRWTATGGLEDLGSLGGDFTAASGVSADGSVVVGFSGTPANVDRAYRWTAASGMVDLGTLGGAFSFANDVSANGAVIVGQSERANGDFIGFRWTASEGMQDLGSLGGSFSSATAVSGDGIVIVGFSLTASDDDRAFRWTEAQGMQSLGVLPGDTDSLSFGVSDDGAVIVGESFSSGSDSRAFRWTEAEGMQDIGTLGGDTAVASAVSGDGSVIVGRSTTASGDERAALWKFSDEPPESPVIIDVASTLRSVAALANDAFAVMELRRRDLNTLQNSCRVSRAGDVCYSAATDVSGVDGNTDALGSVTVGYGLTDRLSAGVTLGHALWEDLPSSVDRGDGNIGGGVYVQWHDTGAAAARYLRGSLSSNRYDVDTARQDLGFTEAATGDSRIEGWSAAVELGQSHPLDGRSHVGYYGGLRHGDLKMRAFTERKAAFPFRYAETTQAPSRELGTPCRCQMRCSGRSMPKSSRIWRTMIPPSSPPRTTSAP
ncbi:hypothetical protein RSO68_11065 [Halomonas saccharevitans]|uniref:Extracellular repeat, HAF family n=1 Tax=Halomonas saccharevitans TaxID=416872 RepID=A0ABU3NFR3_9GAMM|nr:hypothetical protein [Halomonas saccharevitans]MDT8880018.1 hypothetical protein [Halomonas saccharevitans]